MEKLMFTGFVGAKAKLTGVKVAATGLAVCALLYSVDLKTQEMYEPKDCPKGSVSVTVPKPHIAGIESIMPAKLPRLLDVYADKLATIPLASVAKANDLSKDSFLPKQPGGIYCLLTGKAVAQAAAFNVTIGETNTKTKTGQLSDREISNGLMAAGFKGEGLKVGIAVVLAESGGKTNARCYNYRSHCVKSWIPGVSSVDRGGWQINDVSHPSVSTSCADDFLCASRYAYKLSAHGTNYRQWYGYTGGNYRKFLKRASAVA
jgi:hypothetical protein